MTRTLLLIGSLSCCLAAPFFGARAEPLLAGAAIVDITPKPNVPLSGPVGGGGNASKVLDRLNARALAIQSGDKRVVLCVCDITMIASDLHDRIRRKVHDQTGLPESHLLVSTTHTHRSPRAIGLDLGRAHEDYKKGLVDRVAKAVSEALANLEPAKIGWGSIDKAEHCRNRRWLMKPGSLGPNPFGEKTDRAAMYGGPGKNGVRTVGPVDPEMFMVSAQRPDGSQIGLIANFSIHYGAGGGGVSADYFGFFARSSEAALGATAARPVVAMMSNGTSGDVAPGGKPDVLGRKLAAAAVELVGKMEHRDELRIAVLESEIPIKVRRPDAARVDWAKAVMAGTWNKPAHRWKNKFAKSALALSEYPETLPVRLQVIRLGELAIAATPCEVYAETGLAIKEGSPFEATFNISLANGYNGYLPTPDQHALGGYTTWPAVSSCLAIDAEPEIRGEILRLLSAAAREF